MALVETPVCDFGEDAVDFELTATDGEIYTLDDIAGENGTLIMFICNHCPYVKAIIDELVEDVRELQDAGVGVAAIMSNDTESYPEDSFENMAIFADQHSLPFPYLIDRDQSIAKAYGAVCTPDFFGYNEAYELQYRGRFDSLGRERDGESDHELLEAMLQIAESGQGPTEQAPSMGCSIKWFEGAA